MAFTTFLPYPDSKRMKVLPHPQGSVEWLQGRAGLPTASEFDQLVDSKWEVRTGAMPKSYLARKLAEKWTGGPLQGFGSWATEQGSILESEAIPWFELEYGQQVQRVGLITTDDGRIGCSPDGLIGEDSGIEIKCANIETAIGYLLAGAVPKEYLPQIFGAMLVTGRPTWKFLSYRRLLPALLITVERDEKIIAALSEALRVFLEKFDAAWTRLCDMNGGPPPKPEPQERVKFSWEYQGDENDVVTP